MSAIAQKKADLQKLFVELGDAEKKMAAGGLTQAEGDAIEAKAKEAEKLQAEIDQYEKVSGLAKKGREVVDPVMPATGEQKRREDQHDIVGFVSVGNAFVHSDEFKQYGASGMGPGTVSAAFQFKGLRERFIPLNREQKSLLESKAVPTIGAGVLQADRLADVVRQTEFPRRRLRDVLQVSTTGASSVEYVQISTYTDASTPVAESAAKPEATMATTLLTAPVRTLAVHMPVTEQQLQDVPQIQSMIDNELLNDLARLEEKQFMYGSGAGENLQGILPLAGVPLIARTAPLATQNLDRIKIGSTDVMIAGYEPNAVAIHPIDWEGIVLLKATDNNYLWQVVTDPQTGQQRVWGLAVVETTAMKNPANLQRYLLVGDFVRGATVFDRQAASVQVGWINAQFTQNLRTVRAEERLAFAIKRPTAFAKYETATAV